MQKNVTSITEPKPIHIPEESEKLAEFIGIMLGDGNIHIRTIKDGTKVYQLRIACHSIDDKDYYSTYLKNLFYDLFKVKPNYYFHKKAFTVHVYSSKKLLVKYLISKGLKSGNKLMAKLKIPVWILANKAYTRSCLRGLFDTDGSIYRMSNKDPKLLRISFCNYDSDFLQKVSDILQSMGYHPLLTRRHELRISRKSEVAKFLNEIGFGNLKHTSRVDAFTAP